MAEPVGWVVAVHSERGWYMDSLGMWATREQAEQDKADALAVSGAHEAGDQFVICAVTPVEDGEQ